MSTPDRDSIAARIRALQAKSTANGATEAEALAAAAKARELLDKYQLDMSEVEIRAEGTEVVVTSLDDTMQSLCVRVSQLCDCKVWGETRTKSLKFFGLSSDVQFATWLCKTLSQFVAGQCLSYALDSLDMSPDVADSFRLGIIERINARLIAEAQLRKGSQDSTQGRGLIVVKNALVTEEWAKLNLNLTYRAAPKQYSRNAEARDAGRSAGDKASFGRPLSTGAKTLALGRS